jgi:hypothetical protein
MAYRQAVAVNRFLKRNYSGYLVPTNADIPELDVSFVGDFDIEASSQDAKGVGELTAVSVAPAVANAVHHATGRPADQSGEAAVRDTAPRTSEHKRPCSRRSTIELLVNT